MPGLCRRGPRGAARQGRCLPRRPPLCELRSPPALWRTVRGSAPRGRPPLRSFATWTAQACPHVPFRCCLCPPQAAREASGDDLHPVLEPGAGAQGRHGEPRLLEPGAGQGLAALFSQPCRRPASRRLEPSLQPCLASAAVPQAPPAPARRWGCRQGAGRGTRRLRHHWRGPLTLAQPRGACQPGSWLPSERPACSRQTALPACLPTPTPFAQVKYSDDRRSVWVTTKANAPGGVRTGKAASWAASQPACLQADAQGGGRHAALAGAGRAAGVARGRRRPLLACPPSS